VAPVREGTPVHGVPNYTLDQQVAYLSGMLEEYKKNTPTHKELRDETTGAASRLERTISKEVSAVRESVPGLVREALPPPPKPTPLLQILIGCAATIIAVGTIIYAAGKQSGDVNAQITGLRSQVEALQKSNEQLHADFTAVIGKRP